MDGENVINNVKDYYGKQLKSNTDLKTSVCTNQQKLSEYQLSLYEKVPLEIKEKSYGCGFICPGNIEGTRIIDLGCGTGLDCYFLAQIIGERGYIVGIDMTSSQIEIAQKHLKDFKSNVAKACEIKFICGYLENLNMAGISEDEFDVAISNCVINLTSNKAKVFKSIFDILKVGGELYFSDMYSDREIPREAKENKILWGEGLSGALTWREFLDVSKSVGYLTPRLVSATRINVDEDIRCSIPNIEYISATYRLFKVSCDTKEPVNVQYRGEDRLDFDMFNSFQPREIRTVDGELYSIISQSRYKHLFIRDPSTDLRNECIEMGFNPFPYAEKAPTKCGQSKCC